MILKLRTRPRSQYDHKNNRRRRTLWIFIAVTLSFLVSWTPLTFFTLISEYFPKLAKEMMIYGLLQLVATGTNSIANPILYGYMNENFRKEYIRFYKNMPWYRHHNSKFLSKSIRINLLSHRESGFNCEKDMLQLASFPPKPSSNANLMDIMVVSYNKDVKVNEDLVKIDVTNKIANKNKYATIKRTPTQRQQSLFEFHSIVLTKPILRKVKTHFFLSNQINEDKSIIISRV